MLFKQAPFMGRNELPIYLNQLGLTGTGAEIGVHRGDYAKILLEKWEGKMLLCVDHWKANYDPDDPASQGDRVKDKNRAWTRVKAFPDRWKILDKSSEEASKEVPDNSLDFVYIDACHQYAAVEADLYLWWSKVKYGGLLCGHDIVGEWDRTVQPAVKYFAEWYGVDVYLIPEPIEPWSFYIVKEVT